MKQGRTNERDDELTLTLNIPNPRCQGLHRVVLAPFSTL